MDIRTALLANGSTLRLENGDRWLVGKDDGETFAVYYRPRYARMTKVVLETTDEAIAVDVLLDDSPTYHSTLEAK